MFSFHLPFWPLFFELISSLLHCYFFICLFFCFFPHFSYYFNLSNGLFSLFWIFPVKDKLSGLASAIWSILHIIDTLTVTYLFFLKCNFRKENEIQNMTFGLGHSVLALGINFYQNVKCSSEMSWPGELWIFHLWKSLIFS